MKLIKLSLAAALIVTLAQAEEKLDLGISANMAMTSNYVWRGMTQSDDSPAIQCGFDVDYKGIYAGVWGSNVNFDTKASMEFDAYAGYTNELFGIRLRSDGRDHESEHGSCGMEQCNNRPLFSESGLT